MICHFYVEAGFSFSVYAHFVSFFTGFVSHLSKNMADKLLEYRIKIKLSVKLEERFIDLSKMLQLVYMSSNE
jgi:hypothetical protein